MTVKEAIDRLKMMPQDMPFVVNVICTDSNSFTVSEKTYTDADFSIWYNRGPNNVEVSVRISVDDNGFDNCPGCEYIKSHLRKLIGD